MKRFARYATGALILGGGLLYLTNDHLRLFAQPFGQSNQWPVMGQNLDNSRSQPAEHKVGLMNVSQLSPKWTFSATDDVTATPTVDGAQVYFPDWGGNLYAVNRNTGATEWSHQISEYDQQQGAIARVSPAIHGGDLIFGDVINSMTTMLARNLIAVHKETGALRWITHVDNHPAAVITGSPVVYGDIIYVGVSSIEESLATDPTYPCCSFRGSVVALDANSGRIIWKQYMLPDNQGSVTGYSGNAVWQPPAIDAKRGLLYIGTGNNYEVPDPVKACISSSTAGQQPACFAADDYFDAAMALDLYTGQIKWSHRLQGVDVWTVACIKNPNPMACPEPSSPDYDLGGSGPNLLPNMVGFGQKSGIYWALNPDNGNILWSSVVGPGATLGGIEWGTATDGQQIYIAISNSMNKPYPLAGGSTTTAGAWTALNAATGRIVWQTADPGQAFDIGSVSVANDVLYAPSASGNLYALNTATGGVLWSYQTGGSLLDGPSIADGAFFLGSGYKKIPNGIANNKVYAFSVKNQN